MRTFGNAVFRFLRGISPLSLLVGLLFFAASLTPSLIPRDPFVQGILGGVVTAVGYLITRVFALLWQAAEFPVLKGPVRGVSMLSFAAVVLVVFFMTLFASLDWQNDLRAKMGLEEGDQLNLLTLMGAALVTLLIALLLGAMVKKLFIVISSWLYRWMPPRRANVLGVVAVVLILFVITRDGLLDVFLTWADESYEAAQKLFDDAPPAPENPRITGSAASLVDWAAMGAPGRNFVTSGPDAADISAFSGRDAMEPIRVYIGRANGDTPRERAELALAELKRVGAFDREVLIVTSPTGTGWMDPGSHDPVEYMHNGDIATVSVQYSYLQSPMALVFETETGLEQATVLLEIVHEYWKTLPKDSRPRLYVHGLSLGALSSMYATNLFRLVNDPIDGAFWAGPPFPSGFWNYVQNIRNPDSPWVAPTIGNGSLVRYATHFVDPSAATADWGAMRIVFLQYSSDPIVFYDPLSLFRPPVWMTEPPAPDASEHLRFIPVVTQFQLVLDMVLSFGAPAGHGHAYVAQDYISPWVEVTAPADWTADDTARLKAHCDNGFQNGCSNGAGGN